MSEYYAVQRSSDYLEHYGVRGMKWGVKKAIASGNAGKMGRAYKKAQKHLNKLKDKANVEKQKAIVGVQSKKAARAGLVTAGIGGAAAGGVSIGLKKGTVTPVRVGPDRSLISYGGKLADKAMKSGAVNALSVRRPIDAFGLIGGAAVTAGGLAKTAHHARKAIAAKYRTTQKGHARAVAKADKFKSEMNKTFGTPYAQKLMSQYKEKKSKKRR